MIAHAMTNTTAPRATAAAACDPLRTGVTRRGRRAATREHAAKAAKNGIVEL